MLICLMVFRLMPVIILKIMRERRKIKWTIIFFLLLYCLGTVFLTYGLWQEHRWKGIALLLPSLFPQYLFYGFACWMLLRCVLYAWSERVWNRIYLVSISTIFLGVLTEKYWNPSVLTFFAKFLFEI